MRMDLWDFFQSDSDTPKMQPLFRGLERRLPPFSYTIGRGLFNSIVLKDTKWVSDRVRDDDCTTSYVMGHCSTSLKFSLCDKLLLLY